MMDDRNAALPRLVLLPGMDGTGWLLENFAAALPASLRPLIVRYPVDGCCSYPQVAEFLRTARINSEPYVLLGESYSSVAAIQWAAANPANLKGLVICVGFATPPVHRPLRAISSLLTHLLPIMPRPRWLVRGLTIGPNTPAVVLRQLEKVRANVPASTFAARMRAILHCDARADLARIRVPIVFLHATHDRLVGSDKLKEMLAIQPSADAEIFPGPHLLLELHSKQAAERITEFIHERVEES
ncbi:MAG TPA: alpha/beta fold hydrolase [Acidobacteriaceae bacterium]